MPFAFSFHRLPSTALRVLFSLVLIAIPGVHTVTAQSYSEQFWLGYVNNSRFTERSGVMVDIHWRTKENYLKQNALNIFRAGYLYYLNQNVSLGGGYAYVVQHNPELDEHRGWQQVQWTVGRKRNSFTHRVRLEERFRERLISGETPRRYQLTYRLRYHVAYSVPLVRSASGRPVPALLLFDEFMMAYGKETDGHHFDQNRLFAGVTLPFSSFVDISLGYMNVIQKPPGSDRHFHSHVIRLYVNHQIDWR